ncbi:hypothetical protein [Novosphingobium pokkalii]|uniref:Uncharacterized protein n=1 Tax=Novosphingobium pokkalii TaxID=1770194 RepID=A0ABV7V9W0_9SPHN|nr:hypothetical protein [Novosphingobium pokkalii]
MTVARLRMAPRGDLAVAYDDDIPAGIAALYVFLDETSDEYRHAVSAPKA